MNAIFVGVEIIVKGPLTKFVSIYQMVEWLVKFRPLIDECTIVISNLNLNYENGL